MALNYIEQLLILACATSRFVSIFSFALLVGLFIVISSSAVGLRICVITARIKNEIVLLVKTTINAINALISKTLIDSDTIHAKFVLANTILISYNDINNRRSNQRG